MGEVQEPDRLAEQARVVRAAEMDARLALRALEEQARALAGRADALRRAAERKRQRRRAPRRWSRLTIPAVGAVIVLLLAGGAFGSATDGGWSDLVQRRPQQFVALAFPHPTQLPSQGRPGEEIAVPYTVINHRDVGTVIEESVTLFELPGGSTVWSTERFEPLAAGSARTRTVAVRLPPAGAGATAWRLQIQLSSGEAVYHTVRSAP
jgi:hypothetical protein